MARLEVCSVQQMKEVVLAKVKELCDVFQQTHLPAPDLAELLQDMTRKSAGGTPPRSAEHAQGQVRGRGGDGWQGGEEGHPSTSPQ